MGNQAGGEVHVAKPSNYVPEDRSRNRSAEDDPESFSHPKQFHLMELEKREKLQHLDPEKTEKRKCCPCCCFCSCQKCFKILLTIIAILAILKSIALIAISVSVAIVLQLYSDEVATRLMAMILVAVISAITLCIAIYALVSCFKNKSKGLKIAAIILIVLCILLSVITGTVVNMKREEEQQLLVALENSFAQAQGENKHHSKIWATTQYELNCCGLNGPEDYRPRNLPTYFSAEVPISCCPSYEPSRSDLVQEREKLFCRSRKAYYDEGCRSHVINLFKETANVVMGCAITLVALQAALAVVSYVLSLKVHKKEPKK